MFGQLYDRALDGERCWVRHDDGRVRKLPVRSWLGGRGSDARFDRAVVERVVDLDEVPLLRAHHAFQLVMGALRVVGDAEIADAALGLPGPQGRQMGAPVDEIVDLYQVDTVGLEQTH